MSPAPRNDPGPTPSPRAEGALYAIGAYLIWGVTPAFWKPLSHLGAWELTAWRALFSVGVGLLLVVAFGQLRELGRALRTPKTVLPIAGAALLISINWLVFLYSVETDRVSHTSLGYYVNPLMSVALGFLLLGERLRPAQSVAVAIATAGVLWWTWQLGGLPWISAALAGSFALYGLVQRLASVPPIVGFAGEMLCLAPVAIAYLWWVPEGPWVFPADTWGTSVWIALSGVVTAAPLVLFANAARRLPLVMIGVFQYIAPTLALLLAVLAYAEPFTWKHAGTFVCVWIALAIFTFDSFRTLRRSPGPPASPATQESA
ncbi:MAG: EamA family transporter RarD [Myxococcota bacterium]